MYVVENWIFYSLLTWSIITLLIKWDLRELLSGYAPNQLIQKAIDCDFCLSHHIAVLLIIPQFIVDFDLSILFVPLFVATTVNKCLN